MRQVGNQTARLTIVLGAALIVAGCGGGEDATNAADTNTLDANLLLDQPANDASALESAVNATEPVVTEGNEQGNATDVLGETSGGDTGGNTVETNVSGT